MNDLNRRRFLAACSSAGVAGTLLPGALLTLLTQTAEAEAIPTTAQAAPVPVKEPAFAKITPEMVDAAAAIAGITLTDDQKKMMLDGLNEQRDSLKPIRALHMANSVAPAVVFNPLPHGVTIDSTRKPVKMSAPPNVSALAAGSDALAFASVRELAELVRTRKVTSLQLTQMYLARLKKYDPQLHFVIALTEERALAKAKQADAEIAAGKYRGPLHGIPWGAKDLLAVKGYPTTWGAGGFEQQTFDYDAAVVQRLDAAGAVLVAKMTLGALAQGDLWFGGRTRNPWNPKQGSSGSSAGSASSVAAGCVGFAIGTETLGSISSPSTRCGTSGLRPTFGFVPRTGAMALSWSMDKIGPICRCVEDCALVMSAIYGPDGNDLAVQDAAFNWDADFDWKKLRVGYLKSAFDPPVAMAKPESMSEDDWAKNKTQREAGLARRVYEHQYDGAALDALRKMGVNLLPVELPDLPYAAMVPLLEAEGAAAFDELTRSGRDQLLTAQTANDWPNIFRVARFYSAVDYVQAMRARSSAIAEFKKLFDSVDVIVTPSSNGTQLRATNLTGHPAVIVPNGLRGSDAPPPPNTEEGNLNNFGGPGTPVSITFLGALYSDARLAAFARAYQQTTGFHKLHPKI